MNSQYQKRIERLIKSIPKDIIDINIPRVRGRVPTQAFSEFLTHREQGDWAEWLVQDLINKSNAGIIAVKYGRTDDIISGDPKFPEFYRAYQDELDTIGKKPDLLIFKEKSYDNRIGFDVSRIENEKLDGIAKGAVAALEVRSSAFLVNKYNQYLKTKPKKSKGREFLSFTPKTEDVMVIGKWISIFGIEHFYVQVFFDKIYMIPFEKILEIISNKENKNKLFTIEENAKNQFKSTIHISVEEGICLTEGMEMPQHVSSFKELDRGRLLFYVKFKEGTAKFKIQEFLNELKL
jgi:hypothetical protein